MGASLTKRPDARGLGLQLALGGGALSFALVMACGLALEWMHPAPSAPHVVMILVAALAAGGIGAAVGSRMGSAIARPLTALGEALRSPGVEGVAASIPVGAPAEVGETARGVAAMARAFVLAREELAAAAGRIHAESNAIHEAASRRSAQAQSEAASINQTNAAALEIAQSTQRSLEQADSVIAMAARSEELSADGARVVADAVKATSTLAEHVRRVTSTVTELSDRTSQIAEIVVTVQDLAEQTDLVALNASVEAAKAGEQGRGFAVVAMEMRQLAEQSRQAATQVRAILAEIDRGTQVSASATEEGAAKAQEAQHLAMSAGEALDGLILVIRNSASAAREIAEAAHRQTGDVQSMVSSFGQLVRSLNAGAEDAGGLERSARALADLSRALADRASVQPLGPDAGAAK
ncbi:MAG TPA: methyl-accepting chemotaxis protein [Anaeromyxobacteraceae bacterium]|nr:methyl-accepting chemotaxis protein [Anaeromyxobacteraceae bacterium]